MKREREILHPLWLRIWHWVHGVAIILLVLTGVQIRFPDLLIIFGNLKRAITIHNLCGFVVLFDYFLWFLFYSLRKELFRQYIPTKEDLIEGIPAQANYYFARIFLGDPPPFEPTPQAKFNSLQKTTYFGIMFVMLPLQVITGLLLWDIESFRPIIEAVGGVRVVDAFHIILAYIFISFLILHLYLATLGHTFLSHFKAMIVGYEEAPEE